MYTSTSFISVFRVSPFVIERQRPFEAGMLQRNVLIAFFNFFCLLCFSVIKCFFFLVLNTASLVISICYCPVPFFSTVCISHLLLLLVHMVASFVKFLE